MQQQGRSSPHPSCQLPTCQPALSFLLLVARHLIPPTTPPSTQSSPRFHLFLLRLTALTSPARPTNLPYSTLSPIEFLAHDPRKNRPWCASEPASRPWAGQGTCRSNSASEAGLSSRPIRFSNSNSRPSKHLRDGTETTGRTPHHLLLVTLYQSQSPNTTIRLVPAAGAARRMKH